MMYEFSVGKMNTQSCNCVGRRPGFPKCPCMMVGLIERDGRWIEPEKDLGPVNFRHSKPIKEE
jgi:hypothetical protein